jgi:hypothetical protein
LKEKQLNCGIELIKTTPLELANKIYEGIGGQNDKI